MIGWFVALFVAVLGTVVCVRINSASERRVQRIRDWLEDLAEGRPPREFEGDAELAAVAEDVGRVVERIDTIIRERTVENANLQTILQSMTEGLMVIDREHIIRRVNSSFYRMLDLKSDPVGQSILRASRNVDLDELITTVLARDEADNAEISLGAAKAQTHLSLTATPMRNASGEVRVLLIGHDVTRLKQLEDVRREFVANVSHELRTPLAIFQGYLENLLDCPTMPEKELVGMLEVLKKHSTRLNSLVEDLLTIARLESRTERLNIELIETRGLIEDIAADWRNHAAKKDIQLEASLAPETPDFEADAFRIEQILNNLVENALKYTERGGSIVVRAGPCPLGIEICVEDNGIGLTPQDLPHIFERFFRADRARNREQGGTGLGLSIVKHLAHLHGGTVHAESTYGHGTTIFLQLPLLQPYPAQPSTSQPRGELQAGVDRDQNQAEANLID